MKNLTERHQIRNIWIKEHSLKAWKALSKKDKEKHLICTYDEIINNPENEHYWMFIRNLNINKACTNCDGMELHPDESCPNCGRQ